MNKDLGTTTSCTLSNQPTGDQRVANAAPTPGPWRVDPQDKALVRDTSGNLVADCDVAPDHKKCTERANLIAEAGTVHHETGLTPQQLRAAWDESRSMLLGAECAEQSLAKENEQLREQRDELLAVLKALAKEHHDILASGDCGCTDPAKCGELIAANAAIAKVEGRS